MLGHDLFASLSTFLGHSRFPLLITSLLLCPRGFERGRDARAVRLLLLRGHLILGGGGWRARSRGVGFAARLGRFAFFPRPRVIAASSVAAGVAAVAAAGAMSAVSTSVPSPPTVASASVAFSVVISVAVAVAV